MKLFEDILYGAAAKEKGMKHLVEFCEKSLMSEEI